MPKKAMKVKPAINNVAIIHDFPTKRVVDMFESGMTQKQIAQSQGLNYYKVCTTVFACCLDHRAGVSLI